MGAFATAAGTTTGLIRTLLGGRTTGTTESSASALSAVDTQRVVGDGKHSSKEHQNIMNVALLWRMLCYTVSVSVSEGDGLSSTYRWCVVKRFVRLGGLGEAGTARVACVRNVCTRAPLDTEGHLVDLFPALTRLQSPSNSEKSQTMAQSRCRSYTLSHEWGSSRSSPRRTRQSGTSTALSVGVERGLLPRFGRATLLSP